MQVPGRDLEFLLVSPEAILMGRFRKATKSRRRVAPGGWTRRPETHVKFSSQPQAHRVPLTTALRDLNQFV